MIVRILNEGQYRLPGEHLGHLTAIDERLEIALQRADRAGFSADFGELLDFVRSRGAAVDGAGLEASDVLLPPADASFDEVRAMLGRDGLVPG